LTYVFHFPFFCCFYDAHSAINSIFPFSLFLQCLFSYEFNVATFPVLTMLIESRIWLPHFSCSCDTHSSGISCKVRTFSISI
jgi:hypothetical protein